MMEHFGTPGSESFKEQAVKGLGWCIGNVLDGGSVLLKGLCHLDNPGDMHRLRSNNGKGVGGPFAPRTSDKNVTESIPNCIGPSDAPGFQNHN